MIDVDPRIAAGLDRMVAGADGGAPDWDDVLSRAAVREPRRSRWAGRFLVPAVGLAIGAAIAAVILTRGPSGGSSGAGSCAALARFHGAEYIGEGVQVAPTPAGPAGTAVLPACTDQPGATTGPQTVRVLRIRGISPRVAFVQVGFQDAIFVRRSLAAHPPTAVARLEHAPACRLADAPIRLRGRWLGILRPNGGTELTMRPPYDVDLLAEHASPGRYLRAFLTVRVPASLGRPLSEADIHGSLQKGGTIAVTATCARGRYVAQSVRAFPPG
jgi:hypothetical protein